MVSVIQIAQRSSGILTTSNSGCGSWWEPLTTQIMQRSPRLSATSSSVCRSLVWPDPKDNTDDQVISPLYSQTSGWKNRLYIFFFEKTALLVLYSQFP